MDLISTRPPLDHVVLPKITLADGEECLCIDNANPCDPRAFIVEMEDGGKVVKTVFPPERAAGAKWVTRAAAEGMINNEDDGGGKLRAGEILRARGIVAYTLRNPECEEGRRVWREFCASIKAFHKGAYPLDWGKKVLTYYDFHPLPNPTLDEIRPCSEC